MFLISHDPLADRIRVRRFRRSKRLRLQIDEQGILITAPECTSDIQIEQFFMEHRDWVEQQLSLMDEKMSVFEIQEENGQRFFLIEGQWVRIEERDEPIDWVQIQRTESTLEVLYPNFLRNRGSLIARLREWCGERTLSSAEQRILFMDSRIRKKPKKLRVSSAKSRWGSCTAKGVISLHHRLFQLSPLALEYVVVHELAHLVHMNHSSQFWNEVQRLMPTYKEGNKKLLQRVFPRGMETS